MADGAGILSYIAGSGRSLLDIHSGGALIAGFDYGAGVVRLLNVDGSGNINVTADIEVDISGDSVLIAGSGGNIVSSVQMNVNNYSANDFGLRTIAGLTAFDRLNSTWRLIETTKSGISALQVGTSGSDFVINEPRAPTALRTRDNLQITNQSGGNTLESGDVTSVTIKFLETGSGDVPQSGYMFVGGNVAPDVVNSGRGLRLSPGDSYTVAIENFNQINIFATLSGEWISYVANQY